MVKFNKQKNAFTLTELIIIIIIISILSTISYLSYINYISKSRDSSRLSQLSIIYNLLETEKEKWKIILPDNKVIISLSWELLAYQWDVWTWVMEYISFFDNKDKKLDGDVFSYSINSRKNKIQLSTFFENVWESKANNLETIKNNLLNSKFDKIPKSYWDKIGTLYDLNMIPIQNIATIQTNWLNIDSTSEKYISLYSDREIITLAWIDLLQTLYWTSITWIVWSSCEDYTIENAWHVMKDWYYLINNWNLYPEYCIMWEWLSRYKACEWTIPWNTIKLRWDKFLQTYDWTNWLPEVETWAYKKDGWCWFECNIWYAWDPNSKTCEWSKWICWYAHQKENIKNSNQLTCYNWTKTWVIQNEDKTWSWICEWLWSSAENSYCYTIVKWICEQNYYQKEIYNLPSEDNLLCKNWKLKNLVWDTKNWWKWNCEWAWTWHTNSDCYTIVNPICWPANGIISMTPPTEWFCDRWTFSWTISWTWVWPWYWQCNWIRTWWTFVNCSTKDLQWFCNVGWIGPNCIINN